MANIDFHVHITPPEISAGWRKYAEKEPYFSTLCKNKNNKFATAEDIIAALTPNMCARTGKGVNGKNQNGVGQEKVTLAIKAIRPPEQDIAFDKAVVFGFGFRDIGLCRYVNDYVIEKVRQYPDRLIGFISAAVQGAPLNGNDAAREIERCYRAGLKGVGELFPAGQGIDLENEKATAAITGACKELGLPVLIHADEPVGHDYIGKTGVALRQLTTFVANNPGLDIVLAHWGGGLFIYETMPEIRDTFRNVYYDTAATPFLYDSRIYRAAKALGLCEKILFGSDFPLLPHSRYFDGLEKSGLSVEEKRQILGGNAQRLLAVPTNH